MENEHKPQEISVELFVDNLMRGMVARQEALRQMTQIDHDSKQMTFYCLAFAMYLEFVINTQESHYAAFMALVAGAGVLANGTLLLHRKFNEYSLMERNSQNTDVDAWRNPSVTGFPQGKFAVGLTSAIAFGAPVVAVIFHHFMTK